MSSFNKHVLSLRMSSTPFVPAVCSQWLLALLLGWQSCRAAWMRAHVRFTVPSVLGSNPSVSISCTGILGIHFGRVTHIGSHRTSVFNYTFWTFFPNQWWLSVIFFLLKCGSDGKHWNSYFKESWLIGAWDINRAAPWRHTLLLEPNGQPCLKILFFSIIFCKWSNTKQPEGWDPFIKLISYCTLIERLIPQDFTITGMR